MTDQTLLLIVLAVVIVLGLGTFLVVPRVRKRGSQDVKPVEPATQLPDASTDRPAPADGSDRVAGVDADTAEAVPPAEVTAAAPDRLETPEPVLGRLSRLRERLARSGSPFGSKLLAVLSRDHLSEDDWDELEETLLIADVGAGPTAELIDALRARVRVTGERDPAAVRTMLRDELLKLVEPDLDRSLATQPGVDGATGHVPAVVLVVGVNGTGKTTTVGKLARVLVAEGSTVLLGAADTFRAAAAEQLTTWGARVGVETVRSAQDGGDPAAVAFDAVRKARTSGTAVVLVDTAGRLQNKAGLMDELGKIRRVITKEAPLSEVLLVLDATTGQNGLNQARVFGEVAGVTGIVLTKLDGTAKGGIVIAVQRELGVPVKLIGLGEGPDDLAPFDAGAFVDGLLGD